MTSPSRCHIGLVSAFSFSGRLSMTVAMSPSLVMVTVSVAASSVAPRDSLPGVTVVVASTEPGTSSMPAPWRCTLSERPRPGLPHQFFGSALFWRIVRTVSGSVPAPFACRSSATAPATCGDDIEVPLMFA